jgi:hypothetical protein
MFTCSRVPKNADFDLRPLYLMAWVEGLRAYALEHFGDDLHHV